MGSELAKKKKKTTQKYLHGPADALPFLTIVHAWQGDAVSSCQIGVVFGPCQGQLGALSICAASQQAVEHMEVALIVGLHTSKSMIIVLMYLASETRLLQQVLFDTSTFNGS